MQQIDSKFVICIFAIIQLGHGFNLLKIPGRGLNANIFQLYDSRSNTFWQINIASDFSHTFIRRRNGGETKIEESIVKNSIDFLNVNDYAGQMQLDAMLGSFGAKIQARGSSNSLSKQSAREVMGKIKIVEGKSYEYADICSDQIIQYVKPFIFTSNISVTHVVIGRQFGLDLEITLQSKNEDNQSIKSLEAKLAADMRYVLSTANLSVDISSSTENKTSNENYSVNVWCNIPLSFKYPTQYKEVASFVSTLPDLISNTTHGIGAVISYDLVEISEIAQCHNLSYHNNVPQRIAEQNIVMVKNSIIRLDKREQRFFDLYADIIEFEDCIPPNVIQRLDTFKNQFDTSVAEFKSLLKNKIENVKFGKEAESGIFILVNTFINSNSSGDNSIQQLRIDFAEWIEKAKYYKAMQKQGIPCLPLETDYTSLFLNNYGKKFFLFLFDITDFRTVEFINANSQLTVQCQACGPTCTCYTVDCNNDIDLCENHEKAEIRNYIDGAYQATKFQEMFQQLNHTIVQEDIRHAEIVNAAIYLYRISYVLKSLIRSLDIRTQTNNQEIRNFLRAQHSVRAGAFTNLVNISEIYNHDIINFNRLNRTDKNPVEILYGDFINI